MNGRWRSVVALCRTVHIYLTLFSLVLMIFFALTGVMLVHGDRLGLFEPSMTQVTGTIPASMLTEPDRLAIVEYLRSSLGAAGAMQSFESDADELRVVFNRPSRRDEAIISRSNGDVTLEVEEHGAAAILTDLHKDFASGPWWWVVVDVAGVLMLLGSLTGLVLWCTLPRRRVPGLAFIACGTIASIVAYLVLVP